MTPRSIVLDSNVIISGFLFGGHPARLLDHAMGGSVACFMSLPVLDEIREVLQRPKFGLSPDQALTLVGQLHDLCEMVRPRKRVRVVAADPDDNAILECAMAASAEIIVTGDAHLLDLRQWHGIRILSPAEAIQVIEETG